MRKLRKLEKHWDKESERELENKDNNNENNNNEDNNNEDNNN